MRLSKPMKNLPANLLTALLLLTPAAFAQSANPHAVSLYNLGLSAYKQGSPESAIIFFKRAADIDPDLADAQYNLGVLYQSQRRLKEAVPRFEEVLRIKPQDQDAHFQLGLALVDLNQYQEASRHFLAIAPNNAHFAEAQKRVAMINGQSAGSPGNTSAAVNSPNNDQAISANHTNTGSTDNAYQASTYKTSETVPSASSTTQPTSSATQYPHSDNGQSTESITAVNQNNQNLAVLTPSTSDGATSAPANRPAAANPVSLLPNSTVQVLATGFAAPAGLAFDRQGNLYIANFLTNTIDRVSNDGVKNQFVSGVNLKGPIGLVIDDGGNLYVANYFAGNIARITPAGISTIIATGFKKPYYLTIDYRGNLFVSQQEDNSVVRITLPKTLGQPIH